MRQSKDSITKTPVLVVPEVLPTIWRMAKLIAYDNEIINRSEPEEAYLNTVETIISDLPIIMVIKLEEWLTQIDLISQIIIATGEHKAAQTLLSRYEDADFANKLFNSFLEGE